MYPPLPFALPRVVPEGGDTVDGKFVPAGVSKSGWKTDQNADQSDHRIDQSCSRKSIIRELRLAA